MERSPENLETYLEGIYNTVIVKDIETRQTRRIKQKLVFYNVPTWAQGLRNGIVFRYVTRWFT